MTNRTKINRKPHFIGSEAYVPISNRENTYAILDRVDFYHLQKRSVDVTSLPWLLNSNGQGNEYVRVHIPGVGITQLSRIIMGEPPHHRIQHLNNNRLDFRRANLGLLGREDVRKVHTPRLPQIPSDDCGDTASSATT